MLRDLTLNTDVGKTTRKATFEGPQTRQRLRYNGQQLRVRFMKRQNFVGGYRQDRGTNVVAAEKIVNRKGCQGEV